MIPPKPKALTAARRGRPGARGSQGSAADSTRRPPSAGIVPGAGSRKFAVGGRTPRPMARRTFMSPAAPAPVRRWPTLDLTEPTTQGEDAPALSSRRERISSPSPTGVPVAWHSTRSGSPASQPAAA